MAQTVQARLRSLRGGPRAVILAIALSSAEAEMVALSEAARDVRYIRRLLASVGHACPAPTPVYEDNASALKWAADTSIPKWNATRHIATRHFAVRQWQTLAS